LVSSIIRHYGYISSEGTENVIQPESVASGAQMLVSIFPAIPFFAACGLLMFYEINKKMETQIEQELKERRKRRLILI
jgi:Na+/melibiose symporter-like transporter